MSRKNAEIHDSWLKIALIVFFKPCQGNPIFAPLQSEYMTYLLLVENYVVDIDSTPNPLRVKQKKEFDILVLCGTL